MNSTISKISQSLALAILVLCYSNSFSRPFNPIERTLSGIITDKSDGTPLPGVTISVPDLQIGTSADRNGKYVLKNIPKGVYLVQYSITGYTTINRKVDFSLINTLNIQLSASTIEAGEVIVTGVSKATELKKSPYPIVAINKLFLDQRAASGNVIDEIASLPGIAAVTTGPNVSKPFIHGLGYNRVVTLQDGVRQEGQQWGDEHGIEIDQNSVDRIEVIKGPASLSYGSDAIGGVVNLISPAPVAEGKVLGSVQGIYGTNQGLLNGSFRLQGNRNGFVWGTIISAKEAKDYQNQHDGRVYNTGYQEKDARIMFGLHKSWGYSYLNASIFDDLQEIPDGSRDSATRKFTRQITEDDAFRPIVPQSVLNSYSIGGLHQHVQLYRIYDNSNMTLGNGNLIFNFGYQYSHRREFTHPTAPDVPGLNLNLDTYTYDIKYALNFGKGYETTFGINGMYQQNRLGESTAFPIPAYSQFDFGPFFILKKSFEKLDVTAGLRYDTRSFHGKAAYQDTSIAFFPSLYTGPNPESTPHVVSQFSPLNKNFSGASGSFGLTYNFSEAFLIKGNIARGFRAPSIAELSANGPDPGSQLYHLGNTNFKPEFSLQEDIGAFLTLPFISASVEVFNNSISKYIFQRQLLNPDGSPLVIIQGYKTFGYVQSKARINGGEVNLDIHPKPWLHFENSLSITNGKNLGTGGQVPDSLKYLPFIPPFHTHTELRGTLNKGFENFKNLYAFIGFDHFNAQNHFFGAYGTETLTAGYNLLNAGIGFNVVGSKDQPLVKIFFEGRNLANVNYQSNLSRLKYFDNTSPQPGIQPGIFNMGRSFSFKVQVPFDLSKYN